MLKRIAHCWLVLSLLAAPVSYVAADLAKIDQGQAHCETMAEHGGQHKPGVDRSDVEKDSCECCGQCESACATCIHLNVGVSSIPTSPVTTLFNTFPPVTSDKALGLDAPGEYRPPRQLRA